MNKIIVVGTNNCGKCNMVKTILNKKGIEYEYLLFHELTIEIQTSYMDMAAQINQKGFPLIIKGGQLITLEEV